MMTKDAILRLQQMLLAIADENIRQWWELYLRGVIPFRGVGIPAIRRPLADWRKVTGIASLPEAEQLQVALALFEQPYAEDKMAGVLYLQLYLQDRLPWESLFKAYESLYSRRLIFDWNTCDWFCVRVLGPTLMREGLPCARVLRSWSEAPYLWQARSGVVPFIKVAGNASYYPDIEAVCSTVIRRDECFAKTSVGWLLRDVSRYDKAFVRGFVERHYLHFSIEAIQKVTKYFSMSETTEYVEMVRRAKLSSA